MERARNDLVPNSLFICNLGITRLPKQLFKDQFPFGATLQILDCNDNLLKSLPDELEQCTMLHTIGCGDNLFTVVPGVLGRCTTLANLYCKDNHFTQIPYALVEKFGNNWAEDTLKHQKIGEIYLVKVSV